MPSKRFMFPFGSPPFRLFAERLLDDEDFQTELMAVVNLPPDQYENVAKALSEHPSFLDRSAVSEIVGSLVPNDGAKPVISILLQLNRMMRESQDPLEISLGYLQKEIEKHTDKFSPTDTKTIIDRIRGLIVVPAALSLQRKAEVLSEATGSELSDIVIISDVRPVFDDEKKQIAGVIFTTTLRIEMFRPDGRLVSVECRLTEPQLEKVLKVAEETKERMSAVKGLLTAKSIPIAKTTGTGDSK